MKTFNTILELCEKLSTETKCIEFFINLRWKDGVECPHCQSKKVYTLKNGKSFRCGNAECMETFSIRTGTVMEASNISIKKWILAIYLATSNKKGISSVQLGKHIGISQQSAWFMLYRIREAKGIKFKSSGMFSGTTEIDECYVGIRDNNHNLLHPFSFKGSMNKELFKEYLQEKLLPFPPKNSYLIMDNASFHKGKDIEKLFKIHEINLMYLPPYSPDLNPIEKKVTIHQTVSHHK